MILRVAVVLVVVASLLGACGGGSASSKTGGAAVPLVADGKVNVEAMQARADAFAALSTAQQEAQLASLDGTLERELWKVSGLEAALGGPTAADAAFAAHSKAIVAQARAVAERRIVLSAFHRADAAPSAGEGLFAGIMFVILGADGVVSATNDLKAGEKPTRKIGDELTVTGSLERAEMDFAGSHEAEGVTTKLRAKVQVNPCPDATGHFEGKARIDVSATTTGGSTGQNGILDVTVSGQVDDDAKLASADSDYRMQWADFAAGKGGFVEVSGAIGTTKVTGATLGRSAGKVTEAMQANASSVGMLYAMMAKEKIVEAAQKGWESGRCVELQPTAAPGPKGLKPASTSQINAAPRSRIDGAPAGGTVTATLSAGGASVDPAGSKVRAPAKFTYTAPDAENKTGTVSMEARSKRGVAKASIDFDTRKGAYVASGGTEVKVSGTVDDLTKPFTIKGTGQGFTVTYSYTPTSSSKGTYTYAGSGSGITMKGSGSYAISGSDPDPLTLTQTGNGCVNIGGCRQTTNVITLTRST